MVLLPYSHGTNTITGEGYTSGYGEGYYTTYAFYNYCPLCGATDCLERYVKGVGELTCTWCDADYSYSGRDKYAGGCRAWLEPVILEQQEPPETSPVIPEQQNQLTPLEKAYNTYNVHKII
jgi:hypothetical protein